MKESVKWVNELKIERTIKALNKNNMNAYLVKDKNELIAKIEELVSEGSTVSCGGSVTLAESGIIDHLRSGRYKFLDRNIEGITQDQITKIYRESFCADAYFASSNAVTEDGKLYNVDGTGNRVAAMLYGPDKVILVVGINKIVKDLDAAIDRNKRICAPANTKRLNKNTPCAKTGYCMDCQSPERICREYTVIANQARKDRMHIIFLNEELGY